jgi:hypothetical protein
LYCSFLFFNSTISLGACLCASPDCHCRFRQRRPVRMTKTGWKVLFPAAAVTHGMVQAPFSSAWRRRSSPACSTSRPERPATRATRRDHHACVPAHLLLRTDQRHLRVQISEGIGETATIGTNASLLFFFASHSGFYFIPTVREVSHVAASAVNLYATNCRTKLESR